MIISITSFGERSNDYETAVQYFRAHFLQVHRRNNENRRVLYTHFTSVVVSIGTSLQCLTEHLRYQDTKATQRIIGNGQSPCRFYSHDRTHCSFL